MKARFIIYAIVMVLLCSCSASKKVARKEMHKEKTETSSVVKNDLLTATEITETVDTIIKINADTTTATNEFIITGNEAIDSLWKKKTVVENGIILDIETRIRPNSGGAIVDTRATTIKTAQLVPITIKKVTKTASSDKSVITVEQKNRTTDFKEDIEIKKSKFQLWQIVLFGFVVLLILILSILKRYL